MAYKQENFMLGVRDAMSVLSQTRQDRPWYLYKMHYRNMQAFCVRSIQAPGLPLRHGVTAAVGQAPPSSAYSIDQVCKQWYGKSCAVTYVCALALRGAEGGGSGRRVKKRSMRGIYAAR